MEEELICGAEAESNPSAFAKSREWAFSDAGGQGLSAPVRWYTESTTRHPRAKC